MGTATGLRISSVNGTAFLDNCPADVLAAVGIGAQIKIYDSSSRYLQGVIDVAGSSEGLGSEHITGWTVTYGSWDTFTVNANGHDIDSAIKSTAAYGVSQAPAITQLALYKYVYNLTVNSGSTNIAIYLALNTSGNGTDSNFVLNPAATGSHTHYFIQNTGGNLFTAQNNAQITNFSLTSTLKQVTAPSSSGVVIKDLSGNQNFISKDASFTYNAASYTYEIISGHPTMKRFGAVPYCTQRVNIW